MESPGDRKQGWRERLVAEIRELGHRPDTQQVVAEIRMLGEQKQNG